MRVKRASFPFLIYALFLYCVSSEWTLKWYQAHVAAGMETVGMEANTMAAMIYGRNHLLQINNHEIPDPGPASTCRFLHQLLIQVTHFDETKKEYTLTVGDDSLNGPKRQAIFALVIHPTRVDYHPGRKLSKRVNATAAEILEELVRGILPDSQSGITAIIMEWNYNWLRGPDHFFLSLSQPSLESISFFGYSNMVELNGEGKKSSQLFFEKGGIWNETIGNGLIISNCEDRLMDALTNLGETEDDTSVEEGDSANTIASYNSGDSILPFRPVGYIDTDGKSHPSIPVAFNYSSLKRNTGGGDSFGIVGKIIEID